MKHSKAKPLWNAIKSRIETRYPDYSIEFEMQKVYGKFIMFINGKKHTICSLTARKNYILVGYNIKKIDNVLQAENLVDTSNKGTNSIGHYRQEIKSEYEINEVLNHLDRIVNFIKNTT